MSEVLIRLERPALLTPELRAWLADRMDGGRAVLTRERTNGSCDLLLRVEIGTHPPHSKNGVQDHVADLMTDLRLLGLRPALVSEQVA
jgi:phospholipase C